MPQDPDTVKVPEKKKSDDAGWWQPAMAVFAEVTGWIVLPIVMALYLGNYLDERQGTSNTYFFICVGVAFLITCAGIGSVAMKYIKQVEQSNKKTDDRKTDRSGS